MSHKVRAVGDYATHLLRALRAGAALNEADPTVVVLTPGIANSAYFEHSLLARQMGVELVEGRDLFCRDNMVYMRTTEGERQVDVIYRRIDDEYLDPMHFRPDSILGVAGLLNAARAGNVVISSAVGNGVGDDKLVYTYVPQIIDYYLGEKPLLQNVDTFRCWLDEECEQVLDRVAETGHQAGGRVRRLRNRLRTRREPQGNWPRSPARSRQTRAGGLRSHSCSCPRCRPRSTMFSRRATWTCGPLPSTTVRTCGCCPAA